MKLFRLTLLAVLLAPVCAAAQGTKTIPLGKNFVLNTKMPLSFDQQEFNQKFVKQLDEARALAALYQAAPAVSVQKSEQAPVPEENYTRCIISREKILKSDGYQITPDRSWYVQKHSPAACEFYKGWKQEQDLSFTAKAEKRHSCESHMDKKYEVHTCAICGKPINAACGTVSTWQDSMGKHYAHQDCFEEYRYVSANAELMKNLDITEADCARFDRQRQERQAAQQKLAAELKASAGKISVPAQPEQSLTVRPGTRSFKKVSRDLERFTSRYSQAIQQAAKDQREGKKLTAKQANLLKRFNSLREEYHRASEASEK